MTTTTNALFPEIKHIFKKPLSWFLQEQPKSIAFAMSDPTFTLDMREYGVYHPEKGGFTGCLANSMIQYVRQERANELRERNPDAPCLRYMFMLGQYVSVEDWLVYEQLKLFIDRTRWADLGRAHESLVRNARWLGYTSRHYSHLRRMPEDLHTIMIRMDTCNYQDALEQRVQVAELLASRGF